MYTQLCNQRKFLYTQVYAQKMLIIFIISSQFDCQFVSFLSYLHVWFISYYDYQVNSTMSEICLKWGLSLLYTFTNEKIGETGKLDQYRSHQNKAPTSALLHIGD